MNAALASRTSGAARHIVLLSRVQEVEAFMKYLVAFAAGSTLALFVAAGIISFFHFVTEDRRRQIARALRVRTSRRRQSHNETAISD